MLLHAISPWVPRAVVLASALALVAIPALVHRAAGKTVVRSEKRLVERALMGLVSLGFLAALAWVATSLFRFADYPLHPLAFAAGTAFLLLGLWLLYRSHADLGANWSITLEVRDGHQLVTDGVYRRMRHPMYLALLLFGLGQALALPNWLAGPFYLAAIVLLAAFRIGPEERLMAQTFEAGYAAYRERSWRLLPKLW